MEFRGEARQREKHEQSLQLESLKSELEDLRVALQQLAGVVAETGGLEIPPRHLQVRVVGRYGHEFVDSGREVVGDLERVLSHANQRLSSFRTILDFGCGCGRVVRPLYLSLGPNHLLHGTDIDAEAIAWCRAAYSRIGEFNVNGEMPPTLYEEGTFDFIFSVSIFTHLPEAMQFAWLRELHRIAKPGAYLVLSVHGKNYYDHIPASAGPVMIERGFYYLNVGNTPGLPDFYQAAFHSQDYIRSRWSEFFEIRDIHERGISRVHDAVVCRKL
jgi:SAM-dependent methyltransferase